MNYKKMADRRIWETLSTQASPNLGINNDDCGSWNNMQYVQWCVSEVQGEGKVTVQLSVVGFVLECGSECVYSTPGWQYGDCNCLDCVTGLMQPSAAFCMSNFPTVSTVQRHCCSFAQWLWLLLYIKLGTVMFWFYGTKTGGLQRGMERELRHTQMVHDVRNLVCKTAMERTCRYTGIIILKSIYDKYVVCLWTNCLGIRCKCSLLYTIQPC